jgi:hypothetical protein
MMLEKGCSASGATAALVARQNPGVSPQLRPTSTIHGTLHQIHLEQIEERIMLYFASFIASPSVLHLGRQLNFK